MTKRVFQAKVNKVYPDKEINFQHNELINVAIVEGCVITNNVYSDVAYITTGTTQSEAIAVTNAIV